MNRLQEPAEGGNSKEEKEALEVSTGNDQSLLGT